MKIDWPPTIIRFKSNIITSLENRLTEGWWERKADGQSSDFMLYPKIIMCDKLSGLNFNKHLMQIPYLQQVDIYSTT